METQELIEAFGRCMRNFGLHTGNSYVIDGCGEYVHDERRPGDNKCKGCGCHRNFHEKVLVLAGGADDSADDAPPNPPAGGDGGNPVAGKVRARFSEEQRRRMLQFAQSKGWKAGRTTADHEAITLFCHELGITSQSFKVWMQNHKNDP